MMAVADPDLGQLGVQIKFQIFYELLYFLTGAEQIIQVRWCEGDLKYVENQDFILQYKFSDKMEQDVPSTPSESATA